jgi:hypothetical protein
MDIGYVCNSTAIVQSSCPFLLNIIFESLFFNSFHSVSGAAYRDLSASIDNSCNKRFTEYEGRVVNTYSRVCSVPYLTIILHGFVIFLTSSRLVSDYYLELCYCTYTWSNLSCSAVSIPWLHLLSCDPRYCQVYS